MSDTKNCSSGEVCLYQKTIEELQVEVARLTEQAQTDALTHLFNYRFFVDALQREMERAQRSLQPMCMIMIDVDFFKKLNDRWGHEIGNQALQHIAKIIHHTVRKLDIACRFGGEEFVVILPNTDIRQSVYVAKRIREVIEQSPLSVSGDLINMTASLGVDEYKANCSDTQDGFVERVDSWLYKAKQSGRNQVIHPDFDREISTKSIVTDSEKDALFNAFSSD
jgi:diguanylate cyclase (GGDEF)-like protein